MPKAHYHTNCCLCTDAEPLREMISIARDVTLATIRRNIDRDSLRDWESGMGYDVSGERGGLRLKDDWHVSYHKSRFEGRNCYYIVHSRVEHIFLVEQA